MRIENFDFLCVCVRARKRTHIYIILYKCEDIPYNQLSLMNFTPALSELLCFRRHYVGSVSRVISQMIVDMLLRKLLIVFPLLARIPLGCAAFRNALMCIIAQLMRINLRLMRRDNTCSWRLVKNVSKLCEG